MNSPRIGCVLLIVGAILAFMIAYGAHPQRDNFETILKESTAR